MTRGIDEHGAKEYDIAGMYNRFAAIAVESTGSVNVELWKNISNVPVRCLYFNGGG